MKRIFNFFIEPEYIEKIKIEAKVLGISAAAFIRKLITEYFDRK